jgi:hypothetical protein
MILYNITIIIEDEIERDWLIWMHNIHIPEVMAAGQFVSKRLLKVLDSPNEGITYCVQFISESREAYNNYRLHSEPALMHALQSKFANRLVSFNTIMEFIDQ